MVGAARRDLGRDGEGQETPLPAAAVVQKEWAAAGNRPCLRVFVTAGCTAVAPV